MSKPDPHQLIPSIYSFSCRIGTRFTDVDPNNHVNFAAMSALFGEGRGIFHAHLGREESVGVVVVSMKIDYIREAFYPDPVDIFLGVAKIGDKSWTFQQLALQNDRPVALCTSVMVMAKSGRAILSPHLKEALGNYHLQSV